jgi:hypothetical protein
MNSEQNRMGPEAGRRWNLFGRRPSPLNLRTTAQNEVTIAVLTVLALVSWLSFLRYLLFKSNLQSIKTYLCRTFSYVDSGIINITIS